MEEVVSLTAIEGSIDFSMLGMFLKSDLVVKFVIILLVIFSIQSWKTIIQKILLINKLKKISKSFENHFWSGVSLDDLYQRIDKENLTLDFCHTLNGSSLALPRVLASIIENFQTDKGILIPKVLHKYTGFSIIN